MGARRSGSEPRQKLLDEIMPRYDVNEVHEVWVPAAPAAAYGAIKAVTPREIRLFAPLMAIRMLPSRLKGRGAELEPAVPLLRQFVRQGFLILDERPGYEEFVMGGIGRFWRLSGDEALHTIETYEDFISFAEPGYAKAGLDFTASPEGDGTRIVTETRVVGTDPEATKLFRRYWFAIRLGSAAIRRSWLAGIRRRIEREHESR